MQQRRADERAAKQQEIRELKALWARMEEEQVGCGGRGQRTRLLLRRAEGYERSRVGGRVGLSSTNEGMGAAHEVGEGGRWARGPRLGGPPATGCWTTLAPPTHPLQLQAAQNQADDERMHRLAAELQEFNLLRRSEMSERERVERWGLATQGSSVCVEQCAPPAQTHCYTYQSTQRQGS